MKLIAEILQEDISYVAEENKATGEKDYFIEGPFLQSNIVNKNNRQYPKQVLANEVARYDKEYIQKKRAYGELGHPQGPTINLERVSHIIQSLKEDGDNFVGRAKIMDTPYGTIAVSYTHLTLPTNREV